MRYLETPSDKQENIAACSSRTLRSGYRRAEIASTLTGDMCKLLVLRWDGSWHPLCSIPSTHLTVSYIPLSADMESHAVSISSGTPGEHLRRRTRRIRDTDARLVRGTVLHLRGKAESHKLSAGRHAFVTGNRLSTPRGSSHLTAVARSGLDSTEYDHDSRLHAPR